MKISLLIVMYFNISVLRAWLQRFERTFESGICEVTGRCYTFLRIS